MLMMEGIKFSCAKEGEMRGSMKSRIRSTERRATDWARLVGGRTRRSTWQISW